MVCGQPEKFQGQYACYQDFVKLQVPTSEYAYDNRKELQQEIERLRPYIQFHIGHGSLMPHGTKPEGQTAAWTDRMFPRLLNSPTVHAYVQLDYHSLGHLLHEDLNVRILNSRSTMFCDKLLTREHVEGRETCASVYPGSNALSRDMCMFIFVFLSLLSLFCLYTEANAT